VTSLDEAIRARHSVRRFDRERLVPQAELAEVFALAQRAPSNCNVQPWRVYVASGRACDRLRDALLTEIRDGNRGDPEDPIDAFPGDYRRLQIECAVALYGALGVERGDVAGRTRAMRRNYEFFDAPHVAIVCMEKSFGVGVALDVGVYLQTLMLAMTSRGIASCAQASLRNYPRAIRAEIGIPAELRLLCGLSFGYEIASAPENQMRQAREATEANVVFLNE
jgi:nitroreductase